MNTHRETILTTIVALLTTAGLRVFRSRADALARDELPAIIVKPGGEQAEKLGGRMVKRTFQVLFEVQSKSDTRAGLTADQTADPAIALMHETLFADTTLGGMVAKLNDREMQEPQFAEGDETRLATTIIYEALYATDERTITKPTNGAI